MRISIPKILVVCLSFLMTNPVIARTESVASPDGNIIVEISDDKLIPGYRVLFHGEEVVTRSRLGLLFRLQPPFFDGYEISRSDKKSEDKTWVQPWGEREKIRENYNEVSLVFSDKNKKGAEIGLRFRVFNDGIGFRYEVAEQPGFDSVDITDEVTEFNIPNSQKATAWWIPGRKWNRYEYLYNTTSLDKADLAHTPFTFKLESGTHISIHEAALVDYAAMVINQQRPGHFKSDLTPWSDGIRVKTKTPFKSPWRTLQISKTAVGLLNSNLILNLNEPNVLGDVSWVKPGKYVGIWWGMHIGENTWGSGDKHGATTEETIRYMDFAAKYGFSGVLVEGWNVGWDGDWYSNGDVFSFTKTYPDFDIKKVSSHAKKNNVKLIGHHETSGSVTNYAKQMGDAFDLYRSLGVSQVKTGYVADAGKIKRIDEQGIARYEWHDGQFMAGEYLRSVKEAAKRRISINTHEPIKDTGLRRTYPNWITREGARGQEFNAWGTPPNSPEHTAILPYTRMLSGPMDFTPGIFNLAFDGLDAINRVQTTLAKQLALYVVLYSPIQMAADLPRNYEKNLDAFQFIRDVPVDWQDSRAIAGEVGDFLIMARKERGSDDWYLGALTDENSRTVELTLDFLDADSQYSADIYRDGSDADWKTNPLDIKIEKKNIKKGDKLSLFLATSGGAAIRFHKK